MVARSTDPAPQAQRKPEPVMQYPVVPKSLRPKQAAALLGCSVATLWRWNKLRQDFPAPRRLSARCTVWDQAELLAWRDAQGAK